MADIIHPDFGSPTPDEPNGGDAVPDHEIVGRSATHFVSIQPNPDGEGVYIQVGLKGSEWVEVVDFRSTIEEARKQAKILVRVLKIAAGAGPGMGPIDLI